MILLGFIRIKYAQVSHVVCLYAEDSKQKENGPAETIDLWTKILYRKKRSFIKTFPSVPFNSRWRIIRHIYIHTHRRGRNPFSDERIFRHGISSAFVAGLDYNNII